MRGRINLPRKHVTASTTPFRRLSTTPPLATAHRCMGGRRTCTGFQRHDDRWKRPKVLYRCQFPQFSPPGGEAIIANLRDPHPLSKIIGKVYMSVLGTVCLDISISWKDRDRWAKPVDPEQVHFVAFIVVDTLPAPVHISVRNPWVKHPIFERLPIRTVKFDGKEIGGHYASHPYWNENSNYVFSTPDLVRNK